MDFITKDFNTLVLLKYHQYDFVSCDTDQRGTKRVHFKDTPQLQRLLLDYDNGKVDVNARDWMRIIEEIKEFVHR